MKQAFKLSSSCTSCGQRSTILFKGGVERHKCKRCGCVWTKSRESTMAALGYDKLGLKLKCIARGLIGRRQGEGRG